MDSQSMHTYQTGLLQYQGSVDPALCAPKYTKERIAKSPYFIKGKAYNLEPTTLETPIHNIIKDITSAPLVPSQTPYPYQTQGVSKIRMLIEILGLYHNTTIPSIKNTLTATMPEDCFVWFGHSSLLLYLGGKTLLVDPVLDGCASPLPFIIRPFNGTNIYSAQDMPEVHYLLITHNHYDHLSKKTLCRLAPKIGLAIVPLGVGIYLEKCGINNIVELDWGEDIVLDSLRVYCLPSRHFSGRGIFDKNKSLWASFLLDANSEYALGSDSTSTQEASRKIFLSGDGGYGAHFKEIFEHFGVIDMAFMENGQYNAGWAQIHSFPHEVLQAALDLHTKVLMPIHNSKFKLSFHHWSEPLEALTSLYEQGIQERCLDFRLITPKIGEIVPFWQNHTKNLSFDKWWRS